MTGKKLDCSFLLNHKSVALPALQICVEAFTWTDGEATTKVCCFCGGVVLLAILTNNVELREFVSKDLFTAVIRGLGMESNAINSPDLVNICREIFIYLSYRDPAPRQVSLNQKHSWSSTFACCFRIRVECYFICLGF